MIFENSIEHETMIDNLNKEISICQDPSIIDPVPGSGLNSTKKDFENFVAGYKCNQCKEFPIIFFFEDDTIEIKCCQVQIVTVREYLKSINKNLIEDKKCKCEEKFESYCFKCKINICKKCKINVHKDHKTKDFETIEKEDNIQELKKEIEAIRGVEKIEINPYIIKNNKDECVKQNRHIKENMIYDSEDFEKGKDPLNPNKDLELTPEYIHIIDIILYHMNNCNPNYSHFSNLKNIYTFLKIRKKNKLFIEYNNTNEKGQNGIIRIFGENFVKNNKDNCGIVFNQKMEELKGIIKIDQDDPTLRVILVENNRVNNRVTNMSELFSKCENLAKIYKESKWETSNVNDMSNMFYKCISLETFPKIKGWDISNVTNLDGMFNGCSSLKILEGLSKWETKNVNDMENLFKDCIALETIEGISEWNTNKVVNINGMFCKCIELKYLPESLKWATKNIIYMQEMFKNCKKLEKLPDISEWDVSKVKNFYKMFSKCKSLKALPELSKWSPKKEANKEKMFNECKSLESLPDISNWFVKNDNLINGCSKLKIKPKYIDGYYIFEKK